MIQVLEKKVEVESIHRRMQKVQLKLQKMQLHIAHQD